MLSGFFVGLDGLQRRGRPSAPPTRCRSSGGGYNEGMGSSDLLRPTDHGLYCEAGDFFVDPWRPVPRAVVTHAHADHACWGCGRYLTSAEGERVLRVRMGREAVIDSVAYGKAVDLGGVRA